jgi:hypothetical protein
MGLKFQLWSIGTEDPCPHPSGLVKKKPLSLPGSRSHCHRPLPTGDMAGGRRRSTSLSASPVPEISSSPISTSHPAGAPHLPVSLFPDPAPLVPRLAASGPPGLPAFLRNRGQPTLALPGWVFDFNLYWHWGCCMSLRAHYAFVLCLYPTQGQVTCLGADSHSVLSSDKIVCFKLIW